MFKVGIVTLTSNPNHGNILQNIALQLILQDLGFRAETITNKTASTLFSSKRNFKQYLKILLNYHDARVEEFRRLRFIKCCRKNINYSKSHYCNGQFSTPCVEQYDYFIAGSDQIWNPYFSFATSFEFLMFAPPEKRVSYAASFGVSNIKDIEPKQKSVIQQGLNGFESISVREFSGIHIVGKYSPKPCYVHLDPTMLITAERWARIATKPLIRLPQHYIVVYLLGNITDEYHSMIELLEEKHHAKAINLLDTRYRTLNPLEFIWLIQNAACVCTDSFHAAVISIIFHKPPHIFNRIDAHQNQNTRFETLFAQCGIPLKIIETENDLDSCTVQWNTVDKKLAVERKISLEYLASRLCNGDQS